MTRTIAPAADPDVWYADIPRSPRRPAILGLAVLLTGVGGFALWATLAPLHGAVVAAGTFVATGQNKIVQHLEGGVIRDIMVKEGDMVEVGTPLLRMDPTDATAQLRRLALRQDRLLAIRARLHAEIQHRPRVEFPPDLTERSLDPEVAVILEGQIKEFDARRATTSNEISILEQGIAAVREGMAGSEAQLGAARRQLEFVRQELESKQHLLRLGLTRRSEVLALERVRAGLEGQIGQFSSAISDAKERIAREQQKILHARSTLVQSATEQLRNTDGELDDVRERIRVAAAAHDRVVVPSPVRGIVVKLFFHTPGGVVPAGRDIVEILPVAEELVIEGRVRPQDIDGLHNGQEAMIRLTALNQRVTPMVPGRVVYISADALPEDRQSRTAPVQNTFVVRARLDAGEAEKLDNFRPLPGMPAELYIQTSERSLLTYLVKPFLDSFQRAFRER